MSGIEVGVAVLLGYGGFVAVMEAAIGTFQPEMEGGVMITTTNGSGETSSTKLAGFELDGHLYVGSNHWLRGWYHRVLANPAIEVTADGVSTARVAVPVEGAEHDRLAEAYRMGFVLRFICGFAPSRFLRLDPAEEPALGVAPER
jgi:hypothetical protein